MDHTRSQEMFDRAKKVLVGGVNSPVRAFKSVEGDPIFFQSAKGAYLHDVDGNSYVDYVGSWGPMILGHAHPDVTAALHAAVDLGTSFGAPGEKEHLLGELVCSMVPSVKKVRFVNSGTEATMSALRLARGATGRSKVIKFEGCYHGHGDSFLIKAGSGAMTFGVPDSAGVTENIAKDTLTAQFNDIDSVAGLFDGNAGQVAAVIVEPVVGNMGCVPPEAGFLGGLRERCTRHGAVLIFDEVMCGFRVARGGAAARYGVTPDMVTLGKIAGGGMPLAAFGGKRAVMEQLAPLGPVYQAGTLSGNPVATACGLATLREIRKPGFFDALAARTCTLVDGLCGAARDAGVPMVGECEGGMFGFFFASELPQNYASVLATDKERFNRFFHRMLDAGVYFAPALYEAGFVSSAHGAADIEATVAAAKVALRG
jgi:glutamate-1-semialdehyde 2,1-aminomutase